MKYGNSDYTYMFRHLYIFFKKSMPVRLWLVVYSMTTWNSKFLGHIFKNCLVHVTVIL